MIKVQTFTFNPTFAENTYILYDESKECIIIDPGCFLKQEYDELSNFIEEQQLKPVKLVNTHCHIDHVLGNSFVKDTYKIPLYIHKIETEVLFAVKNYAELYGFGGYQEASPDHFMEEGELLEFGNSSLEILFVPGHAPGHLAFLSKEQKFLIGGDVLFDGSIGRTDLPGGDFETLINSIHTKLFPLDDEVIVYPGHGPTTTIGKEKMSNPFCALKN